jgi:polyhydroxybutyrate depolymerase
MSDLSVRDMISQLSVAGRLRTFTTVGDLDGPAGRALVIVLHGSRQTGAGHRAFTGRALDGLALEGRAVVAYLDGYRGNWNDARAASRFPARLEGVDDVGFVRAAIDALVASHRIDRARVIVVGYSNGGQMALRLLHEAPELLAGAVVIAATMPAPENFLAPPAGTPVVPRPVALVHGTADRIVPYGGGAMSRFARAFFRVGGRTLSAPETAAALAARNGITAPPTSEELPAAHPRRTRVTRTTLRQDGRPTVTLDTVHDGGHTVPGPKAAPAVLGRTSHDVAVADLVAGMLRP